MENDQFIDECARASAWADNGFTAITVGDDFVPVGMPDGWPKGVDAKAYREAYCAAYVPKSTPEHKQQPTVTDSVTAFRRLVNGD